MSSKVTTKPLMPATSVCAEARTSRVWVPSWRCSSSCASAGRSGVVATPASRPATSGITAISGRPIRSSGEQPIRSAAERFGRVIRPCAVEADHAGRDAGEHRLGEAAALVELAVGADQLAALAAELRGHAVERARQVVDLVVVGVDRHRRGRDRRRAPGRRPRSGARSGVASRLAKPSPTPTAASSRSSATTPKIAAKVTWMPERRTCSERYSSTTSRVRSM